MANLSDSDSTVGVEGLWESASGTGKRPLSPAGVCESDSKRAATDLTSSRLNLEDTGFSAQDLTFSPDFVATMADELELSPLLLPLPCDLPPPMDELPGASEDGLSLTPETVLAADFKPSQMMRSLSESGSLLSSAPALSRQSSGLLDAPAAGKGAGKSSDRHSQWQAQLRATLADADACTRALMTPATTLDPVGTVCALARLSPRQVDALHPPARELVQRLLDNTRQQMWEKAKLGPTPALLEQSARQMLGNPGGFGLTASLSSKNASSSSIDL